MDHALRVDRVSLDQRALGHGLVPLRTPGFYFVAPAPTSSAAVWQLEPGKSRQARR